ncbi:hypothetical protein QR680_007190 [Steinernema hermaphroditum]|uniref:DUF4773 domain-containing protein n=1 Tax=Steinernema hermaphroditum TaxID=289476 RepID=A0AA39LYP6_9BILA|nr:hypothetical protein QR680_007190 [Steinernema hermaphroditum]
MDIFLRFLLLLFFITLYRTIAKEDYRYTVLTVKINGQNNETTGILDFEECGYEAYKKEAFAFELHANETHVLECTLIWNFTRFERSPIEKDAKEGKLYFIVDKRDHAEVWFLRSCWMVPILFLLLFLSGPETVVCKENYRYTVLNVKIKGQNNKSTGIDDFEECGYEAYKKEAFAFELHANETHVLECTLIWNFTNFERNPLEKDAKEGKLYFIVDKRDHEEGICEKERNDTVKDLLNKATVDFKECANESSICREMNDVANSFLDVRLKAHAAADALSNAAQSNISYSLVLLNSLDHHSFESLSLQEPSFLRKTHDETFEDHTIVGLTPSITQKNGKTFLGVQLYNLSKSAQDFYIVDVTEVIQNGKHTKTLSMLENFSLSVAVHRRNEDALKSRHVVSSTYGCQCVAKNCGCCAHLRVRKIRLDDNACWNISYISEDIGLKLSFSINDHISFSEELSVRNPPAYCFEVPHLREYASMCVKLYNIRTSRVQVSGCVQLEARLYHYKIAEITVGCFAIPV